MPGNQSFRWVGKATLTGAAQLGYFMTGGMTIVRASTDADAAAELEIQLTGTQDADGGRLPALSGGRLHLAWIIFLFLLSSRAAQPLPRTRRHARRRPLTTPKKRGPKTPEGKARSRMNALKHGLRAREFGLLPEDDPAEWRQHVLDLEEGYGPVDATERKLVDAIAVAMWRELRADRFEAEVLTDIRPRMAGRSHGSDLQVPDHAAALTTALRYQGSAGMAARRADARLPRAPEGQAGGAAAAGGHARTRDRENARTIYRRRSAAPWRPARHRPSRQHPPSPTRTRGWPTCRWSRPTQPTKPCAGRCSG